VGPKAGLDAEAKIKLLFMPGIEKMIIKSQICPERTLINAVN
jgi:hypothetical protein